MHARIAIHCTMVLVLLSAIPPGLSKERYDLGPYELTLLPGYTFKWAIDTHSNLLRGTLELDSLECWAGIGISDAYTMQGASFMVGQVGADGPVVQERKDGICAAAHCPPVVVADQTAIVESGGAVANGKSRYTFTRRLSPSTGAQITTGTYGFIFAHCSKDGAKKLAFHGGNKGTLTIDFFAGPIEPVLNKGGLYITVVGIGVTVVFLVALILQHVFDFPLFASTQKPGVLPINHALGICLFILFGAVLYVIAMWAPWLPGDRKAIVAQHYLKPDLALAYNVIPFLSGLLLLNLIHPMQKLRVLHSRVISHYGMTFGELALIIMYLWLNVSFGLYWWENREEVQGQGLQRAARIAGHLAELNLSVTLLPVAHNSVWCVLFGVPFDRAVKYHRWLGRVTWICVTAHMSMWWRLWVETSGSNFMLNCAFQWQCSSPDQETSVKWGELAWIFMTMMAIAAVEVIRRRWFEVFYYIHQGLFGFALVFAILHSLHVSGRRNGHLVQYLLPGLVLYITDRAVRVYRGQIRSYQIVQLSLEISEVTRVEVAKQDTGNFLKALDYIPGQYCFINIPKIAWFEWHPFSISSRPGDKTFTFHVKNMGKNSWTAKLARLALNRVNESHGDGKLTIKVDGPYGFPSIDPANYTVLFLIAGGVGITPIAAVLSDLLSRVNQADVGDYPVSKVYLCWVVKEPHILDWFHDLIVELRSHPSGLFDVRLFTTASKAQQRGLPSRSTSQFHTERASTVSNVRSPLLPGPISDPGEVVGVEEYATNESVPTDVNLPKFILGRPKLPELFDDVAAVLESDEFDPDLSWAKSKMKPSNATIGTFVCGPESLQQAVADECRKRKGFHLHKETFFW